MGIFICNICQKECDGINSLRSHSIQKHDITADIIYINYILNKVEPKCECGCGETPPFISVGKGFSRFIRGHHNRVVGKNNFHKDPKTHQRAIETQKKNWKDGKYIGWWENKTPKVLKKIEEIKEKIRNDKQRGIKISKKLKGVPKTEESKKKLSISQKKRYQDNPKLKTELSKKRINWLKSKQSNKKSKLEKKFETILELIGIDFQSQFDFKDRLFDYYIPSKNLLIEVDGDFYHCNPNSKHNEILYETQQLTINNDKIKNDICVDNNITLIRYWEKDINERPEWVILDLRQRLSL